jgi:hypothetical protein
MNKHLPLTIVAGLLIGMAHSSTPNIVYINGFFAIRSGKWKLSFCPGSGGWSAPRPGQATKGLPNQQLYNLEENIKESANLQARHPEVVSRLTTPGNRVSPEPTPTGLRRAVWRS